MSTSCSSGLEDMQTGAVSSRIHTYVHIYTYIYGIYLILRHVCHTCAYAQTFMYICMCNVVVYIYCASRHMDIWKSTRVGPWGGNTPWAPALPCSEAGERKENPFESPFLSSGKVFSSTSYLRCPRAKPNSADGAPSRWSSPRVIRWLPPGFAHAMNKESLVG